MPHFQAETVDLIEIYHARQVQKYLLRHLRRLRSPDPANPASDFARQRETRSYYEAMLLATTELLKSLGDQPG